MLTSCAKRSSPAPNEGDTLVFTVTVTNNGGGTATNVRVEDTLPTGMTLLSATASQGGCAGTSPIVCQLASIANGASATLSITARVDSGLGDGAVLTDSAVVLADQHDPVGANNAASVTVTSCPAGELQNTASVSSSVGDPDPSDNSDRICTATLDPAPSLSMVKSASPNTYGTVGQVISYRFLVTNTGNLIINVLSVADDKTANESCPVTTLNPGDSTTCTATYAITAADLKAGSVTNIANASGTDPRGIPVTSPDGTATVTAKATDVQIVKTVSPATVGVGERVTYGLRVTNNGPLDAPQVKVRDFLSTRVTWVSTETPSGTCTTSDAVSCGCSDPSRVICELGTLGDGDSQVITIIVTVRQ